MTDMREVVARAISRKRADCISQGIFADSQLGHELLAKAAIAAHEAALKAEGLVIVPIVPTPVMVQRRIDRYPGELKIRQSELAGCP